MRGICQHFKMALNFNTWAKLRLLEKLESRYYLLQDILNQERLPR